jgi:hypothetical protein
MAADVAGMEHWELVAREQIRDLVARYAANVDSGRFDEVVSLFAPNATFVLRNRRYEGRDEIRSIFTTAGESLGSHQGGNPLIRHHITTHQIDVLSPTEARSRCYFVAFVADGVDHWGRYIDEFGLVEGDWRFTSRRDFIDAFVPGGWAARE